MKTQRTSPVLPSCNEGAKDLLWFGMILAACVCALALLTGCATAPSRALALIQENVVDEWIELVNASPKFTQEQKDRRARTAVVIRQMVEADTGVPASRPTR